MGVILDSSTSTDIASGTSLSFAITVGSGSNQALVASISLVNQNATGVSATVDGTIPMTLIQGTDTGTAVSGIRTMMFGVTGLASGSHTVKFATTSASEFIVLGLTSMFNAKPRTPFNHGTFTTGTSANPSLGIFTTPGDMTLDIVSDVPSVPSSPTQTQDWQTAGAAGSSCASPANSVLNTHGWTFAGGSTPFTQSGVNVMSSALLTLANFNLSGVAVSVPNRLLSRVPHRLPGRSGRPEEPRY